LTPADDGSRFDEGEIDLGKPVAELATLTEEPSPGFFGRIWRSVERRRLGSDVTEMSLTGLVMVFLEYLGAIFGLVEETGRKDQGEDDG